MAQRNALFGLNDYTTADVLNTPTTSDWASLLMMQGTRLPDAGLGPVTNTTRAGLPNPMLTATEDAPRPNDYMAPVAETLSIPMGAFGAGQLVGSGINAMRNADYASGAGQIALGMAGMLPMAPKGGKGIRAYHASPYDFDKFDFNSNMGRGEGAQAFGQGGYFAESPAVSGKGGAYYNQFKDKYGTAHAYEVNINADPADFLDWDKPLSQQSAKVRDAVMSSSVAKTPFGSIDTVRRMLAKERGRLAEAEQEIAANRGMFGRSKMNKDERAYYDRSIEDSKTRIDEFERILSGDPTASYLVPTGGDFGAQFAQEMRGKGIPGIRYLDQMSRGEGKGSSNYVVFDDALVEILRKYGLLPPVAVGGLAAALGQEDELY